VVNTVLLRPLTYPNAGQMLNFPVPSSLHAHDLHSIPELTFFERQTSILKEVAKDVASFDNAGLGYNLTGGHPKQEHGIHVTEGYFRVYGAPLALGQTFTPQEDSPHGGKVVVLSYGLWQRQIRGRPVHCGKSNLPWAMSRTQS